MARRPSEGTSNLPFLAVIRGRQLLSVGEIGPRRIALGVSRMSVQGRFETKSECARQAGKE
jgi:hypothetical protein